MLVEKSIKIIRLIPLAFIGLIIFLSLITAVLAVSLVYDEDFSTDTYKDSDNTFADWDTTEEHVVSPAVYWSDLPQNIGGYGNISNDEYISIGLANTFNGDDYCVIYTSQTGGENSEIYVTCFDPVDNRWEKMDGTPGTEQVTDDNLVDDSIHQGSITSNSGNIYICWKQSNFAEDGYRIAFSYWDGTAWSKMNGDPGFDYLTEYNGQDEAYINVGFDSNNFPNVSFRADPVLGGISYTGFTRWNGTAWTYGDGTTLGTEDVSAILGQETRRVNMLVDEEPILFFNSGNDYVNATIWDSVDNRWEYMDGTAGIEAVDTNNNDRILAKLDSNGYPHLAFYNNSDGNYNVYYTRWNGTNWTYADETTLGAENVSNIAAGHESVSSLGYKFELDSNDFPNFVWQNQVLSYNRVFFSHWDSVDSRWETMDGTVGSEQISGDFNSILMEASEIMDTINLPINDNPAVAWLGFEDGATNPQIYFTQWNGSDWVIAGGGETGFENITKDSQHAFYAPTLNSKDGILYMIFVNVPIASYPSDFEVFVGRSSPEENYMFNSLAQSTTVDTTDLEIKVATLDVEQTILEDTEINYYLTADGGTNWESVDNGEYYEFINTGSDLRWRAELVSDDLENTPQLEDVSISYQSGNIVPVLDSNIPDQEWDENEELENAFDLDDYFSDPDLDTLVYSMVQDTDHITATIGDDSQVSFSSEEDWSGTEVIQFQATDGEYTVNSNEVGLIVVEYINQSPTLLTNIPDQEWDENEELENAFDLDDYFSDPDLDTLVYSMVQDTDHITATIGDDSQVSFSSEEDWSGTEVIQFQATDGEYIVNSNEISLAVVEVDNPPPPTYFISGYVKKDTTPVQSAEVHLYVDNNNNQIFDKTVDTIQVIMQTNSEGFYRISQLESDDYIVILQPTTIDDLENWSLGDDYINPRPIEVLETSHEDVDFIFSYTDPVVNTNVNSNANTNINSNTNTNTNYNTNVNNNTNTNNNVNINKNINTNVNISTPQVKINDQSVNVNQSVPSTINQTQEKDLVLEGTTTPNTRVVVTIVTEDGEEIQKEVISDDNGDWQILFNKNDLPKGDHIIYIQTEIDGQLGEMIELSKLMVGGKKLSTTWLLLIIGVIIGIIIIIVIIYLYIKNKKNIN